MLHPIRLTSEINRTQDLSEWNADDCKAIFVKALEETNK